MSEEEIKILISKGLRCEDWTIKNEETRQFYIKLERFIVDFPELSDGIIRLYKKRRNDKYGK